MNSSQLCRIAAVQMISGPDVDANLAEADRLIGEAAAQGARLVALPEYFPLMSPDETAKIRIRERDGEGPLQDFLKDAANAVLVGPNGVGKTTLARNLAHQALIHGHTVLFTNAGQLLGDLAALDSDSAFRRRLSFARHVRRG